MEYPESYAGMGSNRHNSSSSRRHRPSVRSYDEHSESTVTPAEDHYHDTRYSSRYAYDNAVPIVQRESSLSRLQEAFADRGPSTRPVTEVSLPQGTPVTPRAPPRDMPPMPTGPPPEMRNVVPEPHQPVLVQNQYVHSVEPERGHSSSRYDRGHERGRSEDHRRPSRRRDEHEYRRVCGMMFVLDV